MRIITRHKPRKLILALIICFAVVLGYAKYNDTKNDPVFDMTPEVIARKYIIAEYEGDKETLLSITRGEANNAVKSGELDIFEPQILHEIVSISKGDMDDNGIYHLSVVVSSITARSLDDLFPSTYYENLRFRKINEKWFIVEVDRDI